ncbi:MAG TPA: zf-HC2 domain-containing protein [Gaiellaceae bacterium]|nr:zf-HC2 domain-containing protein [Gaiellaceae bacterium]
METLPRNCDRARAWVSLRLDGELSELEGYMLDSHLVRCAACRAFAADAAGFTTALRAAELVPLERDVSLPTGRRTMRRTVQFGAAAALVAAAVGLGSLFGAVGSGRTHAPSLSRLGGQEEPAIVTPVPVSYSGDSQGLPRLPAAVRAVRHKGLTLTQGDF